jgi:hypothetical protein
LRTTIETALGRRIRIANCLYGVRVIVNQPHAAVLPVLAEFVVYDRGCTSSRVDIAADYTLANLADTNALTAYCERAVVLKWRSAATVKKLYNNGNAYWCDNRRARNLLLYHRPQDRAVVRLELRFMNSTAVRRAGLANPEALEFINPRELFRHHLKEVAVRPSVVERNHGERLLHILQSVDMQTMLPGWKHPERTFETVEGMLDLIPTEVELPPAPRIKSQPLPSHPKFNNDINKTSSQFSLFPITK